MQHIFKTLSPKDVELLKQKARQLKRDKNVSHTEALEQIAKEAGYSNWHHVCKSIEELTPAEHAYRHGCIIAMDVKDALDLNIDDGVFIDDHEIWSCCEEDLFDMFAYELVDGDQKQLPRSETMEVDELHERFRDDSMNYMFYRLADIKSVKSVHDVLKLVKPRSFWMPQFLWFKGQYFDTYALPVEDDKGKTIGVRF